MQTKPSILALLAGLAVSGAAQAALHDRGGGLIYDDVLNVTWLQDANYAATQYAQSGGMMGDADGQGWHNHAGYWAAQLEYYDSVRDVTWTDWRLPTTAPINGVSYNYTYAANGTTDYGYNISAAGTAYAGSTASELAYMFNQNLISKAAPGPFINVQSEYWSGTVYANASATGWAFSFYYGYQWGDYATHHNHYWALRDGDVVAASVPEPETWAMQLAGLGLVGYVAYRRKRHAA